MKTKKLRRALSVIIAAVMVFAMVPAMAMADEKPKLTITARDKKYIYTMKKPEGTPNSRNRRFSDFF